MKLESWLGRVWGFNESSWWTGKLIKTSKEEAHKVCGNTRQKRREATENVEEN